MSPFGGQPRSQYAPRSVKQFPSDYPKLTATLRRGGSIIPLGEHTGRK